ncbi:MAG: hypothetical protein Q8Q01_04045 [archaeon]|nr:hypothetical protein [archaeon]
MVKKSSSKKFMVLDGKALKNLKELHESLKELDKRSYKGYVNKGKDEFYNWLVDNNHDSKLANQVLKAEGRDEALAIIQRRIQRIERPERELHGKNLRNARTSKKIVMNGKIGIYNNKISDKHLRDVPMPPPSFWDGNKKLEAAIGISSLAFIGIILGISQMKSHLTGAVTGITSPLLDHAQYLGVGGIAGVIIFLVVALQTVRHRKAKGLN